MAFLSFFFMELFAEYTPTCTNAYYSIVSNIAVDSPMQPHNKKVDTFNIVKNLCNLRTFEDLKFY